MVQNVGGVRQARQRHDRTVPDDHVRAAVQFAVVTDLHVGTERIHGQLTAAQVRCDLLEVLRQQPETQFILATGDLTQDGRMASLEALDQVFRGVKVPVFPVFGGHDGREEAKVLKSPLPWAQHFMNVFGPAWYSFEWGRCHIAVYANEDHHFTDELNEVKRRWLSADLERARSRGLQCCMALHAPPTDELAEHLCRLEVRLVVCGHWHSLKRWRVGNTQFLCGPPLGLGGIDMMPGGYVHVAVHADGQLSARYRPLALSHPGRHVSVPARRSPGFSRQIGEYFHRASPALDGERLLVAVNGDARGGPHRICCFEAPDGEEQWSVPVDDAVKHTLTVTGDRLLALTQAGRLLCLDPSDGATIWSRRLDDFPFRWLYAPPAVGCGVVLAGTFRGGAQAFALSDGRSLWSRPRVEARPTVRGDIWPWAAGPMACDEDFLLPMHRHGLMRVEAGTGAVQWEVDWPYSYYLPPPLIVESTVWLPSPEPAGAHGRFDLRTGDTLESVAAAGVPIAWTLHDDCVYLTAAQRMLQGPAVLECIEPDSGKMRWTRVLGRDAARAYHYSRHGPNTLATPIVSGDLVYAACTDGRLRVFDARSGLPASTIELGSPLFGSPVVCGDRLWITTWSGHLMAEAITPAGAEGCPR